MLFELLEVLEVLRVDVEDVLLVGTYGVIDVDPLAIAEGAPEARWRQGLVRPSDRPAGQDGHTAPGPPLR